MQRGQATQTKTSTNDEIKTEKQKLAIKRDISLLFKIPLEDIDSTEIDQHLYNLLIEKVDGILAVDLIYKYRSTFSKTMRDTLCHFILTLLHNPDMVVHQKPIKQKPCGILADLISDTLNPNYSDVVECFQHMDSLNTDYPGLFPGVLNNLGEKTSVLTVFDDFMKYVYPILQLIELESVLNHLAKAETWAVSMERMLNLSLGPKTFKWPKSCFLKNFLEVFIYDRPVKETLVRFHDIDLKKKNDIGKLMEMKFDSDTKLHLLYDTIHTFLTRLFAKRPVCKTHFQTFTLDVIKKNKERAKMNPDQLGCDSDGVLVNISGLLSKFATPIVRNEMFELVDPTYMHKFNDECLGLEIKIKKVEVKSFTSFIFFSKLKTLQLGLMQIFETSRENRRRLEMLEIDLISGTIPQGIIEREKQKLKKNLAALHVCYGLVFRSRLVEEDEAFISFVCSYLVDMFGTELPNFYIEHEQESTDDEENNKKVSEEMVFCSVKTFPEHIYNTIFGIQKFYDDLPASFMILASNIFSANLPNLSFKSSLVVAFESRKSIKLIPDVFNGLLKYFAELDKLDNFEFDRSRSRSSILNTLNADTNQRILGLDTSKNFHLRFLYSFLNDFKESLSEGLSAIKEIKEISDNMHKYIQGGDQEVIDAKKRRLRDCEHISEYSFEQLDMLLNFMQKLINQCKMPVFSHSLIIETFVGILNCNLKIIVGPSSKDLILSDGKKYGFEPRNILRQLIIVYLTMDRRASLQKSSEESIFIKQIVNDQIYFTMDLFNKTVKIARTKFIVGESDLTNLEEFVRKLDIYNEKVNQKEKEEEVPDEFVDPLTFVVMENPVRLLTSGKIVDRETYDMLMLGDGLDPFSRGVLGPDKIVEEVELKKKIDDFYED